MSTQFTLQTSLDPRPSKRKDFLYVRTLLRPSSCRNRVPPFLSHLRSTVDLRCRGTTSSPGTNLVRVTDLRPRRGRDSRTRSGEGERHGVVGGHIFPLYLWTVLPILLYSITVHTTSTRYIDGKGTRPLTSILRP